MPSNAHDDIAGFEIAVNDVVRMDILQTTELNSNISRSTIVFGFEIDPPTAAPRVKQSWMWNESGSEQRGPPETCSGDRSPSHWRCLPYQTNGLEEYQSLHEALCRYETRCPGCDSFLQPTRVWRWCLSLLQCCVPDVCHLNCTECVKVDGAIETSRHTI